MTDLDRRRVCCVLSARSMPYAQHAFRTLLTHSVEPLELSLITDGADDRTALLAMLAETTVPARHRVEVYAQADADQRADVRFARHPNIAAFRHGHPCWRKITDPLLFAGPGDEVIVLDPDLYFPNRFKFEPTPRSGILLMWQRPHCLLPHEVVERAYDSGVRLAHHTDIGVAQWRNDVDLDFLDDLIRRLGGAALPRAMHIESIIWAALAMRMGGGYLDPQHWHCWRNAPWKRVWRKLGASGRSVLRLEDFTSMKCFHGGGIAKWWIPDAVSAGDLPEPRLIDASRSPRAYEELTRSGYVANRRLKTWAHQAGLYRLMGT